MKVLEDWLSRKKRRRHEGLAGKVGAGLWEHVLHFCCGAVLSAVGTPGHLLPCFVRPAHHSCLPCCLPTPQSRQPL